MWRFCNVLNSDLPIPCVHTLQGRAIQDEVADQDDGKYLRACVWCVCVVCVRVCDKKKLCVIFKRLHLECCVCFVGFFRLWESACHDLEVYLRRLNSKRNTQGGKK